MSKALGPGVRVWIGWMADSELDPELPIDPRLKIGIITDGPHQIGLLFKTHPSEIFSWPNPMWGVLVDGLRRDQELLIAEPYLFPLDDDDGLEGQDRKGNRIRCIVINSPPAKTITLP